MKHALELCSLALNPSAPAPTASMVKVEDGFMISYGGTMCIRVPVKYAFGCTFDPTPMKTFFRKERERIGYTVKASKLTITEGKEKMTIPVLPPESMPTIDVISPVQDLTVNLHLVRYFSTIINPTHQNYSAQGVNFNEGFMLSTNGYAFMVTPSGLPDGVRFNIHKDVCAALAKFKSKLVGMAIDTHLVKFCFEDGSSLITHSIVDMLPLSWMEMVSGDDWVPMNIPEKVVEDLIKIEADDFGIDEGKVTYVHIDKKASGELAVPGAVGPYGTVRPSTLAIILRNGGELCRNRVNGFFRSVNDDVCVLCSCKVC